MTNENESFGDSTQHAFPSGCVPVLYAPYRPGARTCAFGEFPVGEPTPSLSLRELHGLTLSPLRCLSSVFYSVPQSVSQLQFCDMMQYMTGSLYKQFSC